MRCSAREGLTQPNLSGAGDLYRAHSEVAVSVEWGIGQESDQGPRPAVCADPLARSRPRVKRGGRNCKAARPVREHQTGPTPRSEPRCRAEATTQERESCTRRCLSVPRPKGGHMATTAAQPSVSVTVPAEYLEDVRSAIIAEIQDDAAALSTDQASVVDAMPGNKDVGRADRAGSHRRLHEDLDLLDHLLDATDANRDHRRSRHAVSRAPVNVRPADRAARKREALCADGREENARALLRTGPEARRRAPRTTRRNWPPLTCCTPATRTTPTTSSRSSENIVMPGRPRFAAPRGALPRRGSPVGYVACDLAAWVGPHRPQTH